MAISGIFFFILVFEINKVTLTIVGLRPTAEGTSLK